MPHSVGFTAESVDDCDSTNAISASSSGRNSCFTCAVTVPFNSFDNRSVSSRHHCSPSPFCFFRRLPGRPGAATGFCAASESPPITATHCSLISSTTSSRVRVSVSCVEIEMVLDRLQCLWIILENGSEDVAQGCRKFAWLPALPLGELGC